MAHVLYKSDYEEIMHVLYTCMNDKQPVLTIVR